MSGMHLQLVTPTYRPVGGVVKLIDYASHALTKGWRVTVICPEPWSPDLDLFQVARLPEDAQDQLRFLEARRVDTWESDYVLISLPTSYEMLRHSPVRRSPERVIHIIQNVRHENPNWLRGYGTRLLTRPMARISTNDIVAGATARFLDPRAFHEVIPLGHDTGYFGLERHERPAGPLRVGYTTWKSDVGDRVASLSDTGIEFRAVRQQVSWPDLRDLYHWADVFLCSPGPEEGFYLPGLEAMAAGCLVVTPDVGGNMAYARPGTNCVLVDYDDAAACASAVHDIAADPEAFAHLRRGGYATVSEFSLAEECAGFGRFLDRLDERVQVAESTMG